MKLKKSSLETMEDNKANTGKSGAFISARLRNPADEVAARGPSTGDKIGGICAIITTVILAIITFLLYANWDLIKSA